MIQDLLNLLQSFLVSGRWMYLVAIGAVIFVIFDILRFLHSKDNYSTTVGIVGRFLGYIMYITAPIRGGKTSLMNGMSHAIQEHLIGELQSQMQRTQVIITTIDYNQLDQDIMARYEQGMKPVAIYEQLKEVYPFDLVGSYDDGLHVISYLDLFAMYIYSLCRLLDNNFVMSTQPAYSRITGTQAKDLKTEWMEVKLQHEQGGPYPIERYNVLMEDDQNIDSKKESHNHYVIAKEDAGKNLWLRIFGHLYKETCYYLTTVQEADRIVKVERELATSILFVESFSHVELQSLRFILNVLRLIIRIMFTMFLWIRYPWPFNKRKFRFEENGSSESILVDYPKEYRKRPSLWKKVDRVVLVLQERLFSRSYLRFKLRKYSKAEEVGRLNSANVKYYDEMILHFPTRYCFGVFDTHAFAFVHELLKRKSSLTYEEVAEHLMFLANDHKSPEDMAAIASKGEQMLRRGTSVAAAAAKADDLQPVDFIDHH